MSNIVQLLTGVAMIYFQLKVLIEVKTECIIGTKNGLFYSESINKNYTLIPQDCDTSLQVLNVSRNNIKELNDNDLANYPQLVELTMRENAELIKISAYFFSPVAETLQIIDISSSCFISPFPELPHSVKRVLANTIQYACNKKMMPTVLPALNHLEFLIEIDYSDNNLSDFPVLHPRTQIQIVNLNKNPMINLKYPDIAQYCTLSELFLLGADLNLIQHRDQCCALNKWGNRSKTVIHLQCADPACTDIEFDKASVGKYEECVDEPGGSFLTIDFYLLNIAIIFTIILSFSYLAFRYYQSEAMKRYQERERLRLAQLENEEDHEDVGHQ